MLSRYKYDLIHLGCILILFFSAVFVKIDNLNAPIGRHHEWVTAHTLITADIWNENGGPSYSGFSPVYTYKSKANFGRKMLGGVTNSEGHHYVSYPPMSFITAYYATGLFGGPDVTSIRVLSLLCGLFVAILLVWVIRNFERNKEKISWIGLIAAGTFIFSEGNLWYFGQIYFADILVPIFVLWSIYLFQKVIQLDYSNGKLVLIGLLLSTFFAVYTEWLGLFWTELLGLVLLIYYFRKKLKIYLSGFIAVFIGSALALITTLVQYTNIKGWDNLEKVWSLKFAERSGNAMFSDNPEFYLGSESSYDKLTEHFWDDASGIWIGFLVIGFGLVITLVLKNLRSRIYEPGKLLNPIILFLSAVLIHYFLFFNFNVLHHFGSVKMVLALILLSAAGVFAIQQILDEKIGKISVAVLGVFALLNAGISAVNYQNRFTLKKEDLALYQSRIQIGKDARSDTYIFTDLPNGPEFVYLIKQDVHPAANEDKVLKIMDSQFIDKAVYYKSSANELVSKTVFYKDLEGNIIRKYFEFE